MKLVQSVNLLLNQTIVNIFSVGLLNITLMGYISVSIFIPPFDMDSVLLSVGNLLKVIFYIQQIKSICNVSQGLSER